MQPDGLSGRITGGGISVWRRLTIEFDIEGRYGTQESNTHIAATPTCIVNANMLQISQLRAVSIHFGQILCGHVFVACFFCSPLAHPFKSKHGWIDLSQC